MLAKFAAPVEEVLNRNLQASLTARRAAAALDGCSMDIGVSAAGPLLRMSVDGGRLRLAEPDDTPAAVSLTGEWRRLFELLGGDHAGPGLDLRGDPALAERFAQLLKHCRPSPEEELARFTGEPVAREVGDAARAAGRWAGDAAVSVRRNVRDFVQEEARLSPTRVEFDAFVHDLDQLRDNVARFAARLRAASEGRGR